MPCLDDEMTPEQFLEPRAIRKVRPDEDGLGYDAELSCGHLVWFAVKPVVKEIGCAECVQKALALSRGE